MSHLAPRYRPKSRPASIAFGKVLLKVPEGSATSWWIDRPQEGFTAYAMGRAVSMAAQHRGPARERLLAP